MQEATKKKVNQLKQYLERGLPLVPVRSKTKKPTLTDNGFKDATTDPEQVAEWLKKYPSCGWGIATGERSGLVVIDVDVDDEGVDAWEDLLEEHDPGLYSLGVTSPSGGSHIYFKHPGDGPIKSTNKKLIDDKGIDVRADGGVIVVPPTPGYTWDNGGFAKNWDELKPVPEWLLERLNGHKPEVSINPADKLEASAFEVTTWLNQLDPGRAENYGDWIEVGMALKSWSLEDGLELWDHWSRKSKDKYEPGACAKKWETFDANGELTVRSIKHWAHEDNTEIRQYQKGDGPKEYMLAMGQLGHHFALNEMNDAIYYGSQVAKGEKGVPEGGEPISDVLSDHIEFQLVENGYNSKRYTKLAVSETAYRNRFHPIRDYLMSLEWDGEDHIAELASYFKDKDGIFELILKRWLVGAADKIVGRRPGQHNPMLVLDGAQGIGKSRFAAWLGSPLPDYFHASDIDPDDKDDVIRQMSIWVWEVEELDSTVRRSDRSALKAHISREFVRARKPYDHNDTIKPTTSSYIGTINSEAGVGFLWDTTGYRRFDVCTLTDINWAYDQDINVNDVWAQAVAMVKAGMTAEHALTKAEARKVSAITASYEVPEPLEDYLLENFIIGEEAEGEFLPTTRIMEILRDAGAGTRLSNRSLTMRIAPLLKRNGAIKPDGGREYVDGEQKRGWRNICPKPFAGMGE